MKPLITIILITILIIAAGCITLYALNSESARLNGSLSLLEQDIENQDWKTAEKKLEEFHRRWDKISGIWSMLIDHNEIDSIELALAQLGSYVKSKEKTEALAQISALEKLIRHIPEKESPSLKNVF